MNCSNQPLIVFLRNFEGPQLWEALTITGQVSVGLGLDDFYLVGGFNPTPLKNDGLRQLGWWHSQYDGKVRKFHASKPPTRYTINMARNESIKCYHSPWKSNFYQFFPLVIPTHPISSHRSNESTCNGSWSGCAWIFQAVESTENHGIPWLLTQILSLISYFEGSWV